MNTMPTTAEQTFLNAILAEPESRSLRLIFSDWLEEQNDPRAEMIRLTMELTGDIALPNRDALEARLRSLLNSGIQPLMPTITNGIGMKLALIPPGKFLMGSPENEQDREDDEKRHEVEITRPFFMGIYTVTQEEYEKVMGTNPSYFSPTGEGADEVSGQDTSRFPVEQVSWEEAVQFCEVLTKKEYGSGLLYRLPTEAEWEYTCRGGATSTFHFGNTLSSRQANCYSDYPANKQLKDYLGHTTTVGSYKPNVFGLYDMHGNVWEWCADWYDEDYYDRSLRQDPENTTEASSRVLRGGCWCSSGRSCRSAIRGRNSPDYRVQDFGFRVAAVQSR